MRSSTILLLAIFLFGQHTYAQTKAKINDVDFHLEDRYLVVNYNLVGSLPKEQLTIELTFITEKNDTIRPNKVYTDVGTKVYGDGAKTILWDVVADQQELSGGLKAIVTITSYKILYSGPSNAFLSILFPGLGGYYVDKNKTYSVLTTLSAVGLIAYGITQKLQADKYYTDYKASKNLVDINSLYTKANTAQQNFIKMAGAGAGIWALDVVWVIIKGSHNKKDAKNAYSAFSIDRLNLNYVNNGVQLGYSVRF
jgi:hypothetical protein